MSQVNHYPTKPKRPTAAQLDVLRDLANGSRLKGGIAGIHKRYIVFRLLSSRRPKATTVETLIGDGLIEAADRDGKWVYYRLTPAGRSLLEQP